MSTYVRELEHADIGQLVALARSMQEESPIYQRFEFEPAMVDSWARLCIDNDDWLCLAAFSEQGTLVGFVAAGVLDMLFSHEKTCDDIGLYVAPSWRGTTTAARLIAELLGWAGIKGARVVRIGITTGINNDSAQHLLERFGFAEGGTMMVRRLDS